MFLLGGFAAALGLFSSLYPFAPLLAAVCAQKKKLYTALVLGTLAGAIITLPTLYGICLYWLPTALLLPLVYVLERFKKTALGWKAGAITLSYALTALLVPMLEYDLLLHALTALTACALLPAAAGTERLVTQLKKRRAVSRGEAESLLVLAVLAACGLPEWNAGGFGFRLLIQTALLCFAALYLHAGEKTGAMLGLLWLIAGRVDLALVFGFSGLTAALALRAGRFLVPFGILLSNCVAALVLTRSLSLPLPVFTLFLGSVPVIALPSKVQKRAGEIFEHNPAAQPGYSLAKSLGEKLSRSGLLFTNLAQVFSAAEEDEKQKRMALVGQTASTVCTQCKKYDYCFSSRYADTLTDLRACAAAALRFGSLAMTAVPAPLKARCEHWVNIAAEMTRLAPLLTVTQAKNENQFMKNECLALAGLLNQMAEECESCEPDDATAASVADALLEHGYTTTVSCLRRKNQPEITVHMRACRGTRDCKTHMLRILKDIFGTPFVCDRRDCETTVNTCSMVFLPEPKLKINACALREAKAGEPVCGDSYSLAELPHGKQLLAISDGCGSGGAAACESESAMNLLETLLEGGLPEGVAYDAMNRLLALKSREDGYSTLDSCIVDLHDGVCTWSKIGAVPGYLVRQGKAERIEGDSLPAGILNTVKPATVNKLLQKDDLLVLVSDGVYDALTREGSDQLADYLAATPPPPDKLCEQVIRLAISANGGKAQDDMTVLAARIA